MEHTNILLCGNPNCGKSTLFNRLCGKNRQTGNFAGVTVDKGVGHFSYGDRSFSVTDLPGTYSLSVATEEEVITRDAVLSDSRSTVLNIIDASALCRGLMLTRELSNTGHPMVVALNMADEMKRRGRYIDCKKLEYLIGVPVVSISAKKGTGIAELKKSLSLAKRSNGGICPKETAYAVTTEIKKPLIDDRIDSLFLKPALGFPTLIIIMILVLYLSFGKAGQFLGDCFSSFLTLAITAPVKNLLLWLNVSKPVTDLIISGAIGGVTGVLSFLPQIFLLFLCLCILEDSGIIARAAFLCNPILSKCGLSGKAVFPLCISFGCTVPAVMSARVTDTKERKILYLTLPFLPCPARLPVYAMVCSAVTPRASAFVIPAIYILGIAVFLISSKMLAKSSGEKPMVAELPPYRFPSVQTLFLSVFDKCSAFVKKAGSMIFIASVIVWLLGHFGMSGYTESIDNSFIFLIGKLISPVFKPLGFANATAVASLLIGIFAKETIVSSFEVLCAGVGVGEAMGAMFDIPSAVAFMVFSLLYTPCIATVSAIRKESGSTGTALFSVIFGMFAAYSVSFAAKTLLALIF